MTRPDFSTASLVFLALAVQPAFAGQITGTVDGRAIDAAVDCTGVTDGPMLQASGSGDGGFGMGDGNGDGMSVSVAAVRPAKVATFDIRFGEKSYSFGGQWVSLDGPVLAFRGTMGAKSEGDGYPVDLVMDCAP